MDGGLTVEFVLVAAGLLLLGLGWRSCRDAWESLRWSQAPGTITHSEVVAEYGDEGERLFSFEVRYSYRVGGSMYEGTTHRIGPKWQSGLRSEAERVASHYPAGCNVSVYVSPRNPADAVLERGASSGLIVQVVTGVVLVGFGLALARS